MINQTKIYSNLILSKFFSSKITFALKFYFLITLDESSNQ